MKSTLLGAVHPVLVLASAAAFSGCGLEKNHRDTQRSLPSAYVKGSFVVETSADDPSVLAQASNAVSAALGCQVNEPEKIHWRFANGAPNGGSVLSEGLERTWNLKFDSCDFSESGTAAILAEIAEIEGIQSIEAEAIVAVSPLAENDRLKNQQRYLPFVERDEACQLLPGARDQKPVVIAIIDSGVDIDHPDLQSAFYRDAQGRIVGANFVGSGAGMPHDDQFDDQNGHGTHVAGLVAATAGNREGIVGVAACANVKIMPVRVLDADGAGTNVEIERGIKWAIDQGADILNLSLGYTATVFSRQEARRPIYDYAASRNVMVFAAAGNASLVNGSSGIAGGYRYGLPAAYKNVIGVAATDNEGRLTGFSNRGDRVDIATPGSYLLSTYPGATYKELSGTSMAAPVAAGIYALALAAARTGELGASVTGRIDFENASAILRSATIPGIAIAPTDVQSSGVLDAKILVKDALSKFGSEQRQVDPQPPPSAEFLFAGFTEGQQVQGPTKFKLEGLPANTSAVYLAWAGTVFTRIKVTPGATSVEDSERWYLWGQDRLVAYAVSADGKILEKTGISLRGRN